MRFTFLLAMLLLFVSFDANAFPKDYDTDTPVVVDIGDVSDLMVYAPSFDAVEVVEVNAEVSFSVVSNTNQVSTVNQFIRQHERHYPDDGSEPPNKRLYDQEVAQLTTIPVDKNYQRTDHECRCFSASERCNKNVAKIDVPLFNDSPMVIPLV